MVVGALQKTMISSTYNKTDYNFCAGDMPSVARWNVAGALHKTNGICASSNSPWLLGNNVFDLLRSSISIWQYRALASTVRIIRASSRKLIYSTIHERGMTPWLFICRSHGIKPKTPMSHPFQAQTRLSWPLPCWLAQYLPVIASAGISLRQIFLELVPRGIDHYVPDICF